VEHVWTVLCRFSVVDQQRNNISLIEIIEQLSAVGKVESDAEIQGLPFPVELVSLWTRTDLAIPEEGRARVRILSPEQEVLNQDESHEYPIDLTQFHRFRAMGKFDVLPYVGNGVYYFIVEYWNEQDDSWLKVASVPLYITLQSPQDE